MKYRAVFGLTLIIWLAGLINVFAQTGLTEDFNDNSLGAGWEDNGTIYALTETNQELEVVAAHTLNSFSVFAYNFSALDLSADPYLKINVKASANFKLRIDFEDINGKVTNGSPLNLDINGNGSYQTLTYNFTGRFNQTWPNTSTVDPAQIVRLVFFVNPGGAVFNGTFQIDDLLIGSNTGILPPPGDVKLNQLGFYPNEIKTAIAVKGTSGPFYIVSEDKQDTVYTGTLGTPASFALSGETVCKAVFTDFTTIGKYYLAIPTIGYSNPFEIRPDVHHAVSKAGLKGFYYQRASTALLSTHAGIWARAKGHADESVIIHNSAASPLRPANSVISCPRGWYDAGDYNKYLATAGMSSFMLLSMYEHYPTYFDTLDLNIPESGNAIPDVLDEALWEIRWMLTMQDPYDGGVYSKLTSPNFDGSVMPASSGQFRYVVKKSTAAALNFSASLAQTARIVKLFENELPGLADSCINASLSAWKWARKNPNVQYIQSQLSSPTINTGEYGDGNFTDEFQWAAMELYATTLIDSFYTIAGPLININPPGWANVGSLGYLSLSHLRKGLTSVADTATIKQRIISQANYLVSRLNISPYGIPMHDSWSFNWGSNGQASSQGVILLCAYDISKDITYLRAAIASLDYLMGRNAANYCFVTGFGTVSPMDIHHRPSVSDGIVAPVPGLLAGGPNTDDPSDCGGSSSYPSALRASAYLDAYCSYSTNEIAINWNAPFAFLSNVIEAIESGAVSKKLDYEIVTSTTEPLSANAAISSLQVYPVPAKGLLNVDFVKTSGKSEIILTNLQGVELVHKENNQVGEQHELIDVSSFNKGIYFLLLKSGDKVEARKIILE